MLLREAVEELVLEVAVVRRDRATDNGRKWKGYESRWRETRYGGGRRRQRRSEGMEMQLPLMEAQAYRNKKMVVCGGFVGRNE
ncbi:hypothetical protein PS1_004661 [Malus domestica]